MWTNRHRPTRTDISRRPAELLYVNGIFRQQPEPTGPGNIVKTSSSLNEMGTPPRRSTETEHHRSTGCDSRFSEIEPHHRAELQVAQQDGCPSSVCRGGNGTGRRWWPSDTVTAILGVTVETTVACGRHRAAAGCWGRM